jgi:hypothetical protein
VGWAPLRAVGSQKADAPPVLTSALDNLNGMWRFRTDPEEAGEQQGRHLPQADDSGWKTLRVPGYWEPQGVTDPRPGMPPKPKIGTPWTDYDGVAWYRKTVIVPSAWAGKRMALRLGSVDDADRTYVNGTLVGETPITRNQAVLVQRLYRLEPALIRFGGANTIAVRVTDGGGPGGMMGPSVSLVPEEALTAPVRLPSGDRPLEARFTEPPAASRMLKIIHGWPDEPEAQDALIRTLAGQGFGGVVCNVSFAEYLRSEPRWQSFVRAVTEARKAGMAMWLYDEKGYPSGSADGLTLKDRPEWEAQGLLVADAVTRGEAVDLAVPPGKLHLAAAYPMSDGRLIAERAVTLKPEAGRVRWQPPGGTWHVMVITEDRIYEGTHAANSLGDRLPYIDLIAPQPTARFLEVTHDAYAKRLGTDLGKYFVSTFTDEPSLMSLFLRRMPYRVLPWSPVLAREFKARRRYDLEPRLADLVGGDSPVARKTRYDFWLTIGEMVSSSFFGQIQQWCRAHNVLSGGHLLMEENLALHVPLYGDFMACARRLDAPSIDCLTSIPSEVPWHIARMIGSVADLEGRTVTMSETSDHVQNWREPGDTRPQRIVSEAEIRGTCNRLMLGGINTITSYYTFRDLSGEQLRRLNAYVGRCSTMLTGGHQVTDIAVVYPIESAWIRFRPSRHMVTESPETGLVEQTFRGVSDALYGAGRDFTYVDSKAILASRVERGTLVHGKLRWRVVVLPHADTLPMAAWRKLKAFAAGGGVVIAVGALPANSEREFPSVEAERIGSRLFGTGEGARVRRVGPAGTAVYLPRGTEHLLGALLGRILEPDAAPMGGRSPLRIAHRSMEGREVYFVINDAASPWQGKLKFCGVGPGRLWDPMSGKWQSVAGPDAVSVMLEPYAGVLVTFARARAPRLHSLGADALPTVSRTPIPPDSVTPGAGEFVEASVKPAAHSAGAEAAWDVTGRLKRSAVDTHLFAMLRYSKPMNLAGHEFLTFRVSVPDGQRTAPQLLVIVTDRRGVQYWAETGRSLAVAGKSEIMLPLNRFSHAPFSTGPGGAFDWSSVAAISIGWGGHFGTEGDTITFTLETPAVGRIVAGR